MSQQSLAGVGRPRLVVPMLGRDRTEGHRAATPLELFFDLVFVVAVAAASARLHHGLTEGAVASSLVSFALVFFAIWWAWMQFTWFASAYDTDDITYRLFVFVSMTGALVLAAGVGRAFDERDFTVVVVGYVILRLAMVTQWIRVGRSDLPRRRTARRFAAGVSAVQVGWVAAALFAPRVWWLPLFLVLAAAELLVPVWAEAASPTTWHPEHITERYGLFTLIVLGESVAAASLAMQSGTEEGLTAEFVTITIGGLLIVFSMWWLYFDRPAERQLTTTRIAFIWGYGHLLIFASAAAVGAGLAVAIDYAAQHSRLGATATGLAVTVPVVIYLLSLWVLYSRAGDRPAQRLSIPVAAVLVPAAALTGIAVLLVGVVLAVLVAVKVGLRVRTVPHSTG